MNVDKVQNEGAASKPPIRKSTTHQERYYHFDLWKEPNRDLAAGIPTSPRFWFSDVSVYARRHNETGEWHMAVALCSILDQFSRRIGRQVARRRFFRDLSRVHLVGQECHYARVKDIVNKILIEEVRTRTHTRVSP